MQNKSMEVVISGISGRFPMSDNLDEFWENLVNGKDMISDEHDRFSNLGMKFPTRMGVLNSLDKFDAEFFSTPESQVNMMSPKLRILQETTFEAIIDAGILPASLQGSNTGVYVGASLDETGSILARSGQMKNVYGVLGNEFCMLASRLSYTFNLNGPSIALDTACSASSVALQQGLQAIQTGLCDAVIVSGGNTKVDPYSCRMFFTANMTSPEGKCKTFDSSANGFVRSEAVISTYICKRQGAKRAYATLLHAATNCDGYKKLGIHFPSAMFQEKLARQVYEGIGLDPLQVDYIEAHGTGTQVGDREEMTAISKVFCEGRKGPLLVGSVKSNMGHAEQTSGLCGITKLVLSHCTGILPANLHYCVSNPEIPSLVDGRVQVVDTNRPFNAKYCAINSMGFGGVNSHVLLKFDEDHQEEENPWNPSIPLVILGSGRTEEAVNDFLKRALSHHENQHFVKLIHELSKGSIEKNPFRGYVVTTADRTEMVVEKNEAKQSVWFICTGFGGQWPGMSRDVSKFDAFRKSITKSAEYLSPYDFNLMDVLESPASEVLNNIQNVLVGISAVQIGLIDLLKSIGVEPDGIIGYSVGEFIACYADECVTQAQSLLLALNAGRALLESNLPLAIIVSVGLTWEDANELCPEGVYPIIHNSKQNTAITGTPERVNPFVKDLEEKGVFIKRVKSARYGFHSPLVYNCRERLLKLFGEIGLERKLRSEKWLSSSVPAEFWDTEEAKYSTTEYYVNNGFNPVYFYPTVQHIPQNAITLETGPHCFLLSVVKQSLPPDCLSYGLMSAKSLDNCRYFLRTIGACYINGVRVDVGSLYEPVPFPVSSRTPNISSSIKWDHSESWYVPHNGKEISRKKGLTYFVDLRLESDRFLEDHLLDGQCIFPVTGYLWFVWRYLASELSLDLDDCPVVFENVRFEGMTFLKKNDKTEFLVNVLDSNGNFQVRQSGVVVCTGVVRELKDSLTEETVNDDDFEDIDDGPFLDKESFYKETSLHEYGLSGEFQGVERISFEGKWAKVQWPGHWISFLDSVLQTKHLDNPTRELVVPSRLQKMIIDPIKLRTYFNKNDSIHLMVNKIYGTVSCSGLELQGLYFEKFSRTTSELSPTITEQIFIPYISPARDVFLERNALESCIEIVLENSFCPKFVFTEIVEDPENVISSSLCTIMECNLSFQAFAFSTVNAQISRLNGEALPFTNSVSKVVPIEEIQTKEPNHFVFIDDKTQIFLAETIIRPGGFILYKGQPLTETLSSGGLILITKKTISKEGPALTLLRKLAPKPTKLLISYVNDTGFDWVIPTQKSLKNLENIDRLVIVSQSAISGINGFVKCLVKEVTSGKIRCFQALDHSIILNFDNPTNSLAEQLNKDLVYNIWRNGSWGYFGNQIITVEEFQQQTYFPCVYVNALKVGNLSSLSWIQSPLNISPKDLIKVHYSSLNFKDVMLASGRLVEDHECALGFEFAGNLKGQRVFGMGKSQCLATYIDPQNLILLDMPSYWDHREAATVAAVYITVYTAVILRGRMKSSESILIHSGSGGVGQAAIGVALSMNSRVFTTVSSPKKRNYLKARFPSLSDENIGNSRNANEFKRHVLKHTQGQGVNLVLNSLAGQSLKASVDCLSQNGRFLEIGKFDLTSGTGLGVLQVSNILQKAGSIYGIFVDTLLEDRNSGELQLLKLQMKKGMESGVVAPLKSIVFEHDQIEAAFRYMAQGKHIGKVIVKIEEPKISTARITALPRTYFHSTKSYIIIGGLGGMGFELTNWMVSRGAKNLVLVTRSGNKTPYHEYHIRLWEEQGTRIIVSVSGTANVESTRVYFQEALKLGPIGGIFNTALVLQDALFDNQTPETFSESGRCKGDATGIIDTLSRQLAPELDYFVVFSSVVSGRGNRGQTNYGFSNSVMERICEKRRGEGLHALAIQWGIVGDVGIVHRQALEMKSLAGLVPQRIKSCIQTLDNYLQQAKPVVSSFVTSKSENLVTTDKEDSLVDLAARILGINDLSESNHKRTLLDLGMDSLMSCELLEVISSRTNIPISSSAAGQLTFEKLAEFERCSQMNHRF